MITKLGSELIKEAFPLQAAMKGVQAGFGLFRKNIIPALSSMKSNVIPAFNTVKNVGSYYPGSAMSNIIPSLRAGGRVLTSMPEAQRQALAFGAKGLGVLGTGAVVGMAANAGNKDYKQKMQEINRFKQYQINPNIPQGDVADQNN